MFIFLKKIVDGFGVLLVYDGIRVGLMWFLFRLYVFFYFNIIKDDILIFSIVNKFIDII